MALAVALRDRRDIAVAHARLDGVERRTHGAVLHRGRAADEVALLGALDCLDAVDHVGGIDKARIREAALLQIIDQRERQRSGADKPDRAARIGRERPGGELGVIGCRVVAGGEARGGQHLLDAAMDAVGIGARVGLAAERPHADHCHQIVARKDDGERVVAVGRRQVSEVFDVAAHVVVVVLHQQNVDLFALHGGAHGGPAAFEFGGGNRRLQASRKCVHGVQASPDAAGPAPVAGRGRADITLLGGEEAAGAMPAARKPPRRAGIGYTARRRSLNPAWPGALLCRSIGQP